MTEVHPPLPERVETVLLDAGGVLLDLDFDYLRRLVGARRYDVTIDALSAVEVEARNEIHKMVEAGGRVADAWREYFHIILGRVGVAGALHDEIIDTLWEAHQRFGMWTVAIEGAVDAVAELKRRGYRIAVVSNAEGRVEADLDRAGYAGLFETVVDSHVVGLEKPDPAIFALALERLATDAATAIYVGDVPSVDVVGAGRAGISPFLVDRHDLYPEWTVPRLDALAALPGWLAENGQR